jgi:hypothetical protein
MKQIYVFGIFISLLIIGCSAPEKTTKRETKRYTEVKKFRNEVNLDIQQNASWVNLMPGSSPKFHVTGKLNLLEGDNYDNNSLELKYIKVYQNSKELYYIIPTTIERMESNLKSITFSTIKGLELNDELNTKASVMFELIFVDGKEKLKYRINDVLVEEVH